MIRSINPRQQPAILAYPPFQLGVDNVAGSCILLGQLWHFLINPTDRNFDRYKGVFRIENTTSYLITIRSPTVDVSVVPPRCPIVRPVRACRTASVKNYRYVDARNYGNSHTCCKRFTSASRICKLSLPTYCMEKQHSSFNKKGEVYKRDSASTLYRMLLLFFGRTSALSFRIGVFFFKVIFS